MKKHNALSFFSRSVLLVFLSTIFLLFILPSCKTTRYLPKYFENLPKDTILRNLVTKDFELKIQKGDLINIYVSSLDPLESAIFNAPEAVPQAPTTGSLSAVSGFLVDMNGKIFYPKLGFLAVEGLTRDQLRDQLLRALMPYLKDPVVSISFTNHQVTVLGDVKSPQILNMANENLTLLQAIGLSGELNLTARLNNVLVIRDSGSIKEFKRVNLTNSSIFTSDFYYLRPNDIVYVEQDPGKIPKTNTGRTILPYVAAGVSVLSLILTRVIK